MIWFNEHERLDWTWKRITSCFHNILPFQDLERGIFSIIIVFSKTICQVYTLLYFGKICLTKNDRNSDFGCTHLGSLAWLAKASRAIAIGWHLHMYARFMSSWVSMLKQSKLALLDMLSKPVSIKFKNLSNNMFFDSEGLILPVYNKTFNLCVYNFLKKYIFLTK